jgi:hypothetical protein
VQFTGCSVGPWNVQIYRQDTGDLVLSEVVTGFTEYHLALRQYRVVTQPVASGWAARETIVTLPCGGSTVTHNYALPGSGALYSATSATVVTSVGTFTCVSGTSYGWLAGCLPSVTLHLGGTDYTAAALCTVNIDSACRIAAGVLYLLRNPGVMPPATHRWTTTDGLLYTVVGPVCVSNVFSGSGGAYGTADTYYSGFWSLASYQGNFGKLSEADIAAGSGSWTLDLVTSAAPITVTI